MAEYLVCYGKNRATPWIGAASGLKGNGFNIIIYLSNSPLRPS